MKPLEALSILNQAASLAPLNRQTHTQVIRAVEVLDSLIKDNLSKEDKDSQQEEVNPES